MIEFFHRTGHDPENFKVEGSAAAIKTLDKRVISFFRKQEKDILNPIRANQEYLSFAFSEFKSSTPQHDQFQQLLDNQRLLNKKFDEILAQGGK